MINQKDRDEYVAAESRINWEADNIISLRDSDEMMIRIMSILTSTTTTPHVGFYYTFIYNPKTPRIEYDQNPLIACTEVFKWGFKGINYHWNDWRNYTWAEIPGELHIVYPSELRDLRRIPYQNYKVSN